MATGTRRLARIPADGLSELIEAGRRMGAVDLALGSPGWPRPPKAMIDQACAALRDGNNQYGDMRGNGELRAALGQSFRTPADPDTELTITVGAAEGLAVAMLGVLDPGDEIVVFEPFFEPYLVSIATASAVPRFVRVRPPDWRWDATALAAAIGPRTKAILVNTPNNPTGHVLEEDEWAVIAELCERHDLLVISDEVYASYVYDGGQHISAADVPGLRDRAIVVGSFSKSHAISGWRIGFLRAAPALTRALRSIHIGLTGGAPVPLQQAVARSGLVDGQDWDPRPDLQQLRDKAVRIFRGVGLRCTSPRGGCYVVAELGPYGREDCRSFVRRLAIDLGVLLAPGQLFLSDRTSDSGFVRIAFNKPHAYLDTAQGRLATLEPKR
ncbi:aminotransferase class I/II-fold pyridoxal phosphate-dependent enzyme [Micromonospora sp. NBC_01655]|uniref:pyridoxal phosphate-dependent aminotransferase n=1 Tax=Micromonospora sp. NBC_01655 TaxID=2975983 RepID=UPI002251514C|nr:aminotransferase class I/II-fold pyridoxal phosphate-dependent enzyme [Micromonospora sp. NBC_01655]MCX4471578.1 aminotransferase class I/II-fold pyridoxal phosphate-dependent enzyme [Micromonospora sp. NBC_01655]